MNHQGRRGQSGGSDCGHLTEDGTQHDQIIDYRRSLLSRSRNFRHARIKVQDDLFPAFLLHGAVPPLYPVLDRRR